MPDAGVTICMIDDDFEDAFLAKRIFSRHAPEVNFVHRSDVETVFGDIEALCLGDAANRRCPEFIFLDLNMPKISGQQILSKLKSHASMKKIPVFVFTTSDEQELVDAAYAGGATAYIVKPQSIDDYRRLVEAFVGFWSDMVLQPRLLPS